MDVQIIIPARYASTRFPGKPLALLGDKTVIQRVYQQAKQVVDNVCVATDDKRIYDSVNAFGGVAIMTSTDHKSGTDRIAEAYRLLNSKADIVINIQGDEPFIRPQQIQTLIDCFKSADTQIATLVRQFKSDEDIFDPNIVKAIFSDATHKAIYFSRSPIPFLRGADKAQWSRLQPYYAHIGMYAYRAEVLQHIVHLPQSTLEKAESLEQLRWLEAGVPITIGITDSATIGIDTPADLEAALKYLQKNNL